FFFSSRRRHTRSKRDWSSDVCSSDLYLTLYAFSTENWSRPKSEVSFLIKLPGLFMNKFLPELMKENVKVETIGHFDKLPLHTKRSEERRVGKECRSKRKRNA